MIYSLNELGKGEVGRREWCRKSIIVIRKINRSRLGRMREIQRGFRLVNFWFVWFWNLAWIISRTSK